MKRKIFSVLAAVLLLSLVIVPVSASTSPQPLVAVGEPVPQEGRIDVEFTEGMTLGELLNISWAVYCSEGYPPHLDITLDIEGDESMLTAEMAYNNSQGAELDSTPSLTTYIAYDEWMQTFELSEGDGFGQIDDSTMFWVTKMGAGNDDAPSGTLSQWKAGAVGVDPDGELGSTAISASTVITKLEIEVDNWVLDTVAYVDNININAIPAVGLSVTTIEAPEIVAVSATPTSIDFGTLYPGQSSGTTVVTVENVGTVTVDVSALVTQDTGTVFLDNLTLDEEAWGVWGLVGLAAAEDMPVAVQLSIPIEYVPAGAETATLVFEATAVP